MKESKMITKERQTKIFNQHGMQGFDFADFYKRFGENGPYHIQDVMWFLGY